VYFRHKKAARNTSESPQQHMKITKTVNLLLPPELPFVSPRSEPLNLSSPLEVGEEVLVRYPSRTIDPGLSAISYIQYEKA